MHCFVDEVVTCWKLIYNYTLAHAPLSLTRLRSFRSWTLVETVALAKKTFEDDGSASFEGMRSHSNA